MWCNRLALGLYELVLALLLALVLFTMIGGVFVLAITNVPQNLWEAQAIYRYIGVFIVVLAPVLALARVAEWWVALYQRFSSLYGFGSSDETGVSQ